MADQKFNTAPRSAEETSNPSISGPLFDDEPLDLDTHGGLVILETGQVAEVTPLNFIPEGGDTSLDGCRVQPLPFDIVETDEGRTIRWREQPYDPATATIGLEAEHPTMDDYEGAWHDISPDGDSVFYPSDRAPDTAERRGHQPEFLKNTTESGSPVKNLSHGYRDFAERTVREKEDKRRWGVHNGMIFVPVSGYPEVLTEDDITEHPYVQMLRHHELMPYFLEYAACTSEQLNIQWKDPEAGSFAINGYQILQSVLNLATSAAPGRDGSLDTTLREHYENNPTFTSEENAETYSRLGRLVSKELGPFMDQVPYDWRELARAYGSPSGGVIQEAAPVDVESFLRRADQQLRNSQTMMVARTLGWHTDRWRPERGVVEISNLSHAGDHPEKMPAAEEVVIKTVQALQEYFADPDAAEHYDDNWDAVIPRPEERRDIHSRQRFVDVSRTNNLLVAVFGKDRNLFDADWEETTPKDIFDVFVDFVDHYGPEPISEEATEEIRATLQHPPNLDEFQTMNDVIAAFYRKGSNMTATETARMAKIKDNRAPEISPRHVLQRMTHVVNRIHRERRAAKKGRPAA